VGHKAVDEKYHVFFYKEYPNTVGLGRKDLISLNLTFPFGVIAF
jgi:hypothetical protein